LSQIRAEEFNKIYPGVWKISFGNPEWDTALQLCSFWPDEEGLSRLTEVGECPIAGEAIIARKVKRGIVVEIPLEIDEQIYGLGLQLHSFNQRKHKKMLRVNSDPRLDLGDSHAPVPFYVSTAGYGVLVDTARYASFTFGETQTKNMAGEEARTPKGKSFSAETFYAWVQQDRGGPVLVEIPS